MKALVENFSRQLAEAKQIADKAIIEKTEGIQNIVVTGMGGSGIGGTIITELCGKNCPVPVTVSKDYFLPGFVSNKTLVIVSSYSGNTEETLSSMNEAIRLKAKVVCVTSGGKILELAKQHGFEFIEIPGGQPPRSCLGYSLVQLIKVFVAKGFADASIFNDLEKSIQLLDTEEKNIQEASKKIAQKLYQKFPIIYTLGSCEGIVVRFQQQINENSKMLCGHNTFPEMNHNELVGWVDENKDLVVVTFRTSFDYERSVKRYEVCKPIFEKLSSGVVDIYAKGESKLEQFMYLVHIGDWISCDLADLKGIDPVEVKVIDRLKSELANF